MFDILNPLRNLLNMMIYAMIILGFAVIKMIKFAVDASDRHVYCHTYHHITYLFENW